MDLLHSKKFQAAILGVAVVVIKHFVPQLDEVATMELLAPILSFIIFQGLADALPGKEKVKMEAIVKALDEES